MGDVHQLVEEARNECAAIVRLARARLVAGDDVTRVQRFVTAAYSDLEDIEAYAVLAVTGDEQALSAIRDLSAALRKSRRSLADEIL